MEYTIIQKGPMLVMGIDVRTTNEGGKAAKDISSLWGRFYRESTQAKIPNQKTGEVLGLYTEYEKDHTKPYTLVAGCEVTLSGKIPEGFVIKKVPAAKYAVFQIKGPFPANLVNTWAWIWQSELRRTYTGDFEIYPPGFHPETNPDTLLYVAIS